MMMGPRSGWVDKQMGRKGGSWRRGKNVLGTSLSGRIKDRMSFGNSFLLKHAKEAPGKTVMTDVDSASLTGTSCDDSYGQIIQGGRVSGGGNFHPLLDGLHAHRWSLTEHIDDEIVESTVDLKPNGEVAFVESSGGPVVKTINGSWLVDPTTSSIRMVIDRTYAGKFMEIKVRSHYSGENRSGVAFSSETGSIGGNVYEVVCDDGCSTDTLGTFKLEPSSSSEL